MSKLYTYLIAGGILFLLAGSLAASWRYSIAAGGTDLRCRIVAARLWGTGHSPYFYHWQPSDGERLLDPGDNPNRRVNGNVVTPAVLTLLYPLATLSYGAVRIIWSLLQYGFLLGCFFLLYPRAFKEPAKPMPWIILVVFACNAIWFYNIERGQVYSLYLFLMSLIYRLSRSSRQWGLFASGCVCGLSVFLRPLLAVFSVPFLVARDSRWLGGFAMGILAGLLVLVVPRTKDWRDYFQAMEEYGREIQGNSVARGATSNSSVPAVIEGMTNLKQATDFRARGLTTVQFYLRSRGILQGSKTGMACYGMAALVLLFLYLRRKSDVGAGDGVFLFGFLLYITAELFVVGFRGGYNLIQWFFPVLLISRSWPAHRVVTLIFITALLLLNGWVSQSPHLFEMAELSLLGGLAWICFSKKYNT